MHSIPPPHQKFAQKFHKKRQKSDREKWYLKYMCCYQNARIPITGNEYASTHIGISTHTGIFLDPLPELH